MHNPLRIPLISLSVALGFVVSALIVAQPLAPPALPAGAVASADEAAALGQAPPPVGAQRERQSARMNLAMPYYSFARLLPRRES